MTRGRRWAVDATHVFCGSDGWCHLTAIIDCWDRNIVGWRLSKTGVAKIAAATLALIYFVFAIIQNYVELELNLKMS